MPNQKRINEGMEKKGGVNPKPQTDRPAGPPPAQKPATTSNSRNEQ